MREIQAELLTSTVAQMCIRANYDLPRDVLRQLQSAQAAEPWPAAQEILRQILENAELAAANAQPICQDTGMACVFLEIGQEVHIAGDLKAAVQEGVRRGYAAGWLRKSVVRDPFDRVNTGDNTPAMLYFDLVPGEQIKITVAPKGFGSENMSRIAMLRPSDGLEGVKRFVLQTVQDAGPNPVPAHRGGRGDRRHVRQSGAAGKAGAAARAGYAESKTRFTGHWSRSFWRSINALGIGPQGFGGRTTALAVNILTMPDAHRGPARGGESQLPCDAPCNGGALRWRLN